MSDSSEDVILEPVVLGAAEAAQGGSQAEPKRTRRLVAAEVAQGVSQAEPKRAICLLLRLLPCNCLVILHHHKQH